jgi:glycosyltransferase involved in cell wall biosynthesis
MKSLHIAYLTTEYIIPPDKLEGGLATYLQKVSYELINRGHQVTVFCLSDRNYVWDDKGVRVIEVSTEYPKPYIRLSKFLPFAEEMETIYLNSEQLSKQLWEIHKTKPIDIIQAASLHSTGITLCGNQEIPITVRISSFAPLLRTAEGQRNSLTASLADWCERFQVENADSVFSPSDKMAQYFSLFTQTKPMLLRTPMDKITTHLDESFYKENLLGKKYLLYFGTLTPSKGIDLLSKAIQPVLSQHPDVHFVFIGKTNPSPEGKTYAEILLQENQTFSTNIHYYPTIPKSKLYPVVKNAFAVIIPSRIENYPNACLEAMQFKKIVVGFRDTSLEEILVDYETGFLASNADPLSLADTIHRVLSLSEADLRKFELSIHEAITNILSEDRISQLEKHYQNTIDTFNRERNTDQINWKRILMIDPFRMYLIRGFLPQFILSYLKKLRGTTPE